MYRWQELDRNPAATAISAAGRQLFQLQNDGSIWRYTGTPCSGSSCPGWEELDRNPRSKAIAAGDLLYQLDDDGSIWRYTGTPCSGTSCPGWQELDVNPGSVGGDGSDQLNVRWAWARVIADLLQFHGRNVGAGF